MNEPLRGKFTRLENEAVTQGEGLLRPIVQRREEVCKPQMKGEV